MKKFYNIGASLLELIYFLNILEYSADFTDFRNHYMRLLFFRTLTLCMLGIVHAFIGICCLIWK